MLCSAAVSVIEAKHIADGIQLYFAFDSDPRTSKYNCNVHIKIGLCPNSANAMSHVFTIMLMFIHL